MDHWHANDLFANSPQAIPRPVFLRHNQRAERGRAHWKWLASSGDDGLSV
jgi:hypothetical protein